MPNGMATSGVLDGLRKEYVGYKKIIAEDIAAAASKK